MHGALCPSASVNTLTEGLNGPFSGLISDKHSTFGLEGKGSGNFQRNLQSNRQNISLACLICTPLCIIHYKYQMGFSYHRTH